MYYSVVLCSFNSSHDFNTSSSPSPSQQAFSRSNAPQEAESSVKQTSANMTTMAGRGKGSQEVAAKQLAEAMKALEFRHYAIADGYLIGSR